MRFNYQGIFSSNTLAKGYDLLIDKRVNVHQIESEKILSSVEGSKSYTVTIYLDGNLVDNYICTCPMEVPCKHFAAVCLYFDEQYLSKMDKRSRENKGLD